jgi:lysophospholipase L1-like esterase
VQAAYREADGAVETREPTQMSGFSKDLAGRLEIIGVADTLRVVVRVLGAALSLAVMATFAPQIDAAHASISVVPAAAATTSTTAPAPWKILPLGDSITYGRWSKTTSSYRIDLQNRLKAAGKRVDFVGSMKSGAPATADLDNEGHPGWRIDQLAARLDEWLATYQPDTVLLLAGTNDMNQNYRTDTAPSRLAAMIDRIHTDQPTVHVFMQTLIASKTASTQARINAFNAAIPAIAANRSSFVHLVDQSGISGVLLSDSLHPNDYGFARMSYNLYRAMAKVYGSGRWPAGTNPYLATSARMCTVATMVDDRGRWHYKWDCATWHLRSLRMIVDGTTVTRKVWQRRRPAVHWYKVWVKPYYKTVTKKARKARIYVAGHYVHKRRMILSWTTA